MNYIDLLTREEKLILCGVITGRGFKELFKKNEREFSKIKKGFRAKSLTEQSALSIATNNLDKPFIATWINSMVERWLKEIQENIEKFEKEGVSHEAAFATTMLDSFFAKNIDLYFKLTGNSTDTDEYSNLYKRMEDIQLERARNAESDERIKEIEEENRDLLDQIEAVQQSVNVIRMEYEQKILAIEREKDSLASLLADANEKINELQATHARDKIYDSEYIASFDDTDTSILPPVGSDEIVSLCSVNSDYNGQKWLIRYADLDHNGYLSGNVD